jgi:hypothetical protein
MLTVLKVAAGLVLLEVADLMRRYKCWRHGRNRPLT